MEGSCCDQIWGNVAAFAGRDWGEPKPNSGQPFARPSFEQRPPEYKQRTPATRHRRSVPSMYVHNQSCKFSATILAAVQTKTCRPPEVSSSKRQGVCSERSNLVSVSCCRWELTALYHQRSFQQFCTLLRLHWALSLFLGIRLPCGHGNVPAKCVACCRFFLRHITEMSPLPGAQVVQIIVSYCAVLVNRDLEVIYGMR